MNLANPIYLWTLLGLAVPIAIHLLSRKEGKVIKLGSIRHVQETSTQQFRGIRLNEVVLLALRCLLIAMLVLGLSGFFFDGKNGKWIVLEPGVEKNKNVQAAIDSLENQGFESHWLSPTFPAISSSPDSALSNYWFTIRQLEKKNLEEAVVFSFAKVGKFKGSRPSIDSNIKIIPVEPEEKKFLLEAIQHDDSIRLRTGVSNANSTSFQSEKVIRVADSVSVTKPRQIKILLVSDKNHAKERTILLAAIRAIDEATPHVINISEKNTSQYSTADKTHWLFWIADEKAPATNANVLKWQPDFSNNLIEQSNKNQWALTRFLTEEVALNSKLTLTLASLLLADSSLLRVASRNDQRVLPETMVWASGLNGEYASIAPPFSAILFGLFSLVFLFERYLAYRKNQ